MIVLIGAVFTKGAFGKLAAVLVIAVVAWVALAPGLAPELSTPDGPYRLSLSGTKSGDELVVMNTRCGRRGAVGVLVNLGDSPVDLVLRTTYGRDDWARETVDWPVFGVPAHQKTTWGVSTNTPMIGAPRVACRAAILAARPSER